MDFKAKEFKDKEKSLIVFRGLCKGCGLCIEKCPMKAIKFSEKDLGVYSTSSIEVDISKCNTCGICETVCPDSAVRVSKAETTKTA
jgi:2-oxoglutarate ferredoxin oxidoreductase subunit delta